MPARLRPADPALVATAAARFRAGGADEDDLRLLVKHYLALLALRAPGGAVEVRVPPFAAAQVVGGAVHKRGTPPAVVELAPRTWVALALGATSWAEAASDGLVHASGERSDLSAYLPLG